MAENTTEVLAGGAVLAVAIGFLAFAAQGMGLGGSGGTYDLLSYGKDGEEGGEKLDADLTERTR